jgi:KDO2-lipid IV(A) lauroyltransferase
LNRKFRLPRFGKNGAAPLGRRLSRSAPMQNFSATLVRGAIGAVENLGSERALRWAQRLVKLLAPVIPETRTAAAGIAAAFPEKSAAERKAILDGAWAMFAQMLVEFVFLEELAASFDPARPNEGRITVSGLDEFVRLRDDGKPGIIVAAHLANWEILSVVAQKFGLKTVIPFRAPNNLRVAEEVLGRRRALMGTLVDSGRGATFELAAALDAGGHLGMLVDQRLNRGVDVPFFGRPALTNPLAARFARQYDCPVHAARAIRRPDGGLHLELTGPLDLPRDAEGLIDIGGAMAAINALVETWVREHPEQWFWLHDRWKH